MSTRLLLSLVCHISALLAAQVAVAVPITIAVEYSSAERGDITCSAGLPPQVCDPTVFDDFGASSSSVLAFIIDSSQREVDGSYDVTSSLSGSFWDSHQTFLGLGAIQTSLTAMAVVQSGLVSDLLLDLGFSLLIDESLLLSSTSGSNGTYFGTSTFNLLSLNDATLTIPYSGTYIITQPEAEPGAGGPGGGDVQPVPEPGSMVLLCLGLVGIAISRMKTLRRAV